MVLDHLHRGGDGLVVEILILGTELRPLFTGSVINAAHTDEPAAAVVSRAVQVLVDDAPGGVVVRYASWPSEDDDERPGDGRRRLVQTVVVDRELESSRSEYDLPSHFVKDVKLKLVAGYVRLEHKPGDGFQPFVFGRLCAVQQGCCHER